MKRMLAGMMAVVTVATLVLAEEQAINPERVATRQLNVYGNNPLQIHGTNVTATAAQLNNAATVAGDGTVAASVLTGNIAKARISAAEAESLTVTGAVSFASGSVSATALSGNIAKARISAAEAESMTVTGAVTLATHVLVYRVYTNMVYNDGATTGNVNIVSW